MNASDYRDKVARELAGGSRSRSRSRSITDSYSPTVELDRLQDAGASDSDRIAAMKRLGAASFDIVSFAEHRPDYLQALRAIARQAEPSELRDEALSVLALANDDVVQAFLKDCLESPSEQTVPPAQALRLLAIDDHANVAKIARRLFDQTDDATLKAEALRALSTDPAAETLMETVFQAREEVVELRQIAGTALRQSNPGRFGKLATDILANNDENDELRASTLATLSTLGDRLNDEHRAKLARSVNDLAGGESALIKQPADRLRKQSGNTATRGRSRKVNSVTTSAGDLSVTRKF